MKLAHRVAFELATGRTLTRDVVIHHVCEEPLCVNPKHLRATTMSEHRSFHIRTHCRRGHEFTEKNTYHAASGDRRCRRCDADRRRAGRKAAREREAQQTTSGKVL